jgi:hypothetical protein
MMNQESSAALIDTPEYLCLPRGCEEDLRAVLAKQGTAADWVDKTNRGRTIDVEFKGSLRDEQPLAMDRLLEHDTGLLSGTTAFGKTVVAGRTDIIPSSSCNAVPYDIGMTPRSRRKNGPSIIS